MFDPMREEAVPLRPWSVHPTRIISFRACEPQLVGQCDALRFARILANLVNNAVVHGDPDKPIEVELCARAPRSSSTSATWVR